MRKISHIHKRAIPLIVGIFLLSQLHAEFIEPTDHAPFRREKLPLDVDSMSSLSRNLTELISALDKESPDYSRHCAQILALARSLDPVNRQANDLIAACKSNTEIPTTEHSQLTIAKNRAWRTQAWLISPEAGTDGNILAACLGDVLTAVDPEHSSAEKYKNEQGKWTGWVAARSDFRKNSIKPTNPDDDEEEMTSEDSEDSEEEKEEVTFQLTNATISAPIYVTDLITKQSSLQLSNIQMQASISPLEDAPRLRYYLQGANEETANPYLRIINQETVPTLTKIYDNLPHGGLISLNFGKLKTCDIQATSSALSAAAAVLTASAIDGKKRTGIVVGKFDDEGNYLLSKQSWQLIRSLNNTKGARIIIPSSTVEILPTMLTLEELNFFMHNDVILAKNMQELLDYTLAIPTHTNLKSAIEQYAVIRSKFTGSVGTFVSIPSVASRLQTIATEFPAHASSRMLLIRAQGKQPTKISTTALAHEIRRSINHLKWLERIDFQDLTKNENFTQENIQKSHEDARAILDPVARFISNEDRSLYSEALELANVTRTLARATRAKSKKNKEDYYDNFHDKSFKESRQELAIGIPKLEMKIANILGEEILPSKRER